MWSDTIAAGPEQPEIIRCEDCKYFNDYFVECENENGLRHVRDGDDFCSKAEEK